MSKQQTNYFLNMYLIDNTVMYSNEFVAMGESNKLTSYESARDEAAIMEPQGYQWLAVLTNHPEASAINTRMRDDLLYYEQLDAEAQAETQRFGKYEDQIMGSYYAMGAGQP